MKRVFLFLVTALAIQLAMAQDNPYIVKTKGVKRQTHQVDKSNIDARLVQTTESMDFMGRNFRYYSMCEWKEGMRFMVIPEKYDMLVNTFHDAATGHEESSGLLRHKVMVFMGHEDLPNGRVHVNFTCEDNNKQYYYELPIGSFEDYCYRKLGVPTLAYLGDVDKARELLLNQVLLTRAQSYRVDTEYDGDGYREVSVDKNIPVIVKAIGVGTRAFPVKIIVEDEHGNQFYQNVAMSKTNSGLREDEFVLEKEKFLFQGSFDYSGANMAVSANVKDYLNQTVHTNYATLMSSKGAGKVRDIKVPRFTGFIIDEINPIKNSRYYTLTLRETESRRIYYKDVAFSEEDIAENPDGVKEDFFGYIFGLGDGAARSTSKETRAAIREGRVIHGMSKEEVEMAMGEPFKTVVESDGTDKWMYARSNGVILDVWFDERGEVRLAKARVGDGSETPKSSKVTKKNSAK